MFRQNGGQRQSGGFVRRGETFGCFWFVHPGPVLGSADDQSSLCKVVQSQANDRAIYGKFLGEIALGRQPWAGIIVTLLDPPFQFFRNTLDRRMIFRHARSSESILLQKYPNITSFSARVNNFFLVSYLTRLCLARQVPACTVAGLPGVF